MLTAAVVTTDSASGSLLRASLQQSGLVYSVLEWQPIPRSHPSSGETIPEILLLDLPADATPFFDFAAHVRRLQPTSHIIACASIAQPDPELLLQAMRSGVQEFLWKPIDASVLRELLDRFAQEKIAHGGPSAEKTIVVAGAKGGTGTTTLAANLAVQMAQVTRRRVVLLDLARPFGQVTVQLDLRPRFSIYDAIENLERLDAHFMGGLLTPHNSGLLVLAGVSRMEEWRAITASQVIRVINVAQSCADMLVVDAGVLDAFEWSPILANARMTLLVAEANVPSLWNVERHLSGVVAAGLDPQRFRLVINRWKHTDEETLSKIEKTLKRPIFARIPNDFRKVTEAVNQGMPISDNHNNGLFSKVRQLACELAGIQAPPERRGGLTNLFSTR
jgi:pilus assembly protein CpaE